MKTRLKFLRVDKTRHGKRVVYFRRGDGPRIRLPDDMESPIFTDAYRAAFAESPLPHVRDMPKTKVELRRGRTKGALESALRAARTRSRKKNVPCSLTLEYLFDIAERQEYRCCLTGIEFFANSDAKCRVNPFIPSIDRIDPKLGYTRENVRLTIFAVNAMMLDWGEEVFRQVANSYRYWGTKQPRSIAERSVKSAEPERKDNDFNNLKSENGIVVRSRKV